MGGEKYMQEVRNALDSDDQLLGDVWKLTYPKKKTPDEIKKELDKATSGFVYNYRRYLGAIINGEIPDKPTLAKLTESVLRNFRTRHGGDLSETTKQEIKKREKECERYANDSKGVERENADLESETKGRIGEFEKANVPGIYLYTYPRYLSAPIRRADGDSAMRKYMKIGLSKKNAHKRIREQTTGMPEPPKILEIWVVDDDEELHRLESKIKHHLRRIIGHGVPGSKKEWFLTNEETVVSTINLIGLKRFDDHVTEMSANAENVGE